MRRRMVDEYYASGDHPVVGKCAEQAYVARKSVLEQCDFFQRVYGRGIVAVLESESQNVPKFGEIVSLSDT